MTDIAELALLLAADLRDIDGLTVRVQPPLDDTRMRAAAAARGVELPVRLPQSIVVMHGRTGLGLEFDEGDDLLAQVENKLDHLQDFVAEATTEQWPPCPRAGHRRPLYPHAEDGRIGWYCPETRDLVAELGRLLDTAP